MNLPCDLYGSYFYSLMFPISCQFSTLSFFDSSRRKRVSKGRDVTGPGAHQGLQLSPLQHCHMQRARKPEQKEPSWTVPSDRTSEWNQMLMSLLPCKSLERTHQCLSHKTRSILPDGWPKPKWIRFFQASIKSWGLKVTGMHFLTVSEAGSLKSRCQP